jgi:hypothetical protein
MPSGSAGPVLFLVVAGFGLAGAILHAVTGEWSSASWAFVVAVTAVAGALAAEAARRWREAAAFTVAEFNDWIADDEGEGRHRAG